jgi:hypothetical protein
VASAGQDAQQLDTVGNFPIEEQVILHRDASQAGRDIVQLLADERMADQKL